MKDKIYKKHRRIKITLMIIGLFIIPVYSILFGTNGDLILMTFSQVGGRIDGKLEALIIWGILCSIYFYYGIEYMLKLIKRENNHVTTILAIGCGSLILTVLLPFNTMMYPASSEIHNDLARVAIVLIIISVLMFIFELKKFDKTVFKKCLITYIISLIILVISFIFFKVSSIFQIIFASIMSYFIIIALLIIEKSKKINLVDSFTFSESKKQENSKLLMDEVNSVFEDE